LYIHVVMLWKLQCWYILWTCPSGVSYWTLRGVLSLPSALNAECLSSILTHNSCEALRLCTLCSLVAFFTLLRRRCWQVKDKRMFVCLWAGRHITWRGGRSIFTDYSAVWYLTVWQSRGVSVHWETVVSHGPWQTVTYWRPAERNTLSVRLTSCSWVHSAHADCRRPATLTLAH